MKHRRGITQGPEHRAYNPPYNMSREFWSGLSMEPPFEFSGMTMQVFPLRANLNTLQGFVDSYLNNIFPRGEAGYFRAFLPFVFLMVVNYGKMSSRVAAEGWVSQREILFNVPLAWYLKQGGHLVFYDWAQLAPFIYVDDEMSVDLGREVYGWPKKLVTVGTNSASWMEDPTGPLRVASLRTSILTLPYLGERPEDRVFLEFYKGGSDSLSQFPPNAANPYTPATYLNNVVATGAVLASSAAQMLRGMQALAWQGGATQRSLDNVGHGLLRLMDPNARDVGFNCINLKQFRSGENPMLACYQGITNSRMRVQQINRCGPLGAVQQMMGDPSGNIQILLHRYPSMPIQETLGLEVAETDRAGSSNVLVLRPFFPYWLDLDMTYGEARTVVERVMPAHDVDLDPQLVHSNQSPLRIRTTGGTVSQELLGPLMYPNSTLRVMPLLAQRDKLRAFCDAYLNDTLALIQGGMKVRFEPWGDYVYLVATNNEDIVPTQNNAGRMQDNEVAFYLPVRMYASKRADAPEELRTVALLPILSYTDDDTVANSNSEVQGVPTIYAPVMSPPSTWMDVAGPAETTPRNLLQMVTQVFPGMGQGAGALERTLLELQSDEVDVKTARGDRGSAQSGWSRELAQDFLKRAGALASPELESSRGLALEVLGGSFPINIITLKQFRDATQLDRACYQAIIQFELRLEKVYDAREIEAPLRVRIHDFPSQRIVETLGLIPAAIDYQGENIVYTLRPVRPFWMTVSMSASLGRPLFRRYDSNQWSIIDLWKEEAYFEGKAPEYAKDLSDLLELADLQPQGLAAQVRQWKQANRKQAPSGPAAEKLPIADAPGVVEAIPLQWILEQVLSREWEHRGASCGQVKAQQIHDLVQELENKEGAPLSQQRRLEIAAAFRKPDFCLPSASLPQLDAEHDTFEGRFIALRAPGKPARSS